MRTLIIAILLSIFSLTAPSQERYLKPVDEAAKDPSFLKFRAKLIAAAERRDLNYVVSIVDPKIKNGFGGSDGVTNFRREWSKPSAKRLLWKELLWTLKNGGTFDSDGSFSAPYVYSAWPDDLDGFDYKAIVGTDVNLRIAPELSSAVVSRLSHNIVEIERETVPKSGKSEYPEWWNVKTLGGLRGYVKREFTRSSTDYRAGFEKTRGVWRMTFFLAGD